MIYFCLFSDHTLVEELRANLTSLQQSLSESLRNVEDLTNARNQKAEAHGSCAQTLQNHLLTINRLKSEIQDLNRTYNSNYRELTSSKGQYERCSTRNNWLVTQINQLQEEIRSRLTREEHLSVVQKFRNAQAKATNAVTKCENEKQNLTTRTSECFNSLKKSQQKVKTVNETCHLQRTKEVAALNEELESK